MSCKKKKNNSKVKDNNLLEKTIKKEAAKPADINCDSKKCM